MPFKSELLIEGKTFLIKRFLLTINRTTDEKGRPSSKPAWKMTILIDAVSDTTLTNWMIDPDKNLDGKVRLYKDEEDGKYKDIAFKESSCHHLIDSFKSYTSYAACEVEIMGGELKVHEVVAVKA